MAKFVVIFSGMPGELALTGVEGLDDVLAGGLPLNRLYLIKGEPGVGKTTLALQFLQQGARQGEPVLYISLSETRDEIEEVAQSHGWSLEGISLYELSNMEDYLGLASNSVFHSSEIELSETTKALLQAIEEVNPQRIVFDSLSEMRLLARDPLRYRRQILALKQYFTGRNCTVLLLDDVTAEPTDLQLESIAHGVILLDQSFSSYGMDRRRLRVQKLRGVNFRSGYHDMTLSKGGIRVFPRLIAFEHRHDVPEATVSSGEPTLDQLIGGGLDRGTSNLFLGPAGSGKSTLATLFAQAAAQRGEKVALYLFEESARTLYKRSRSLGIDLQSYAESGSIQIQHVDPAELTPGEFVQAVRDAISSGDVSIVIIDSLNGYLNAMPEDRFLCLQLHELLMYLGQQNVSSILVVAQHGMMGASMATPFDVSYLADTALLFRFFEHHGTIKRAISVIKRRGGAHDRSIRELEFGPDGIAVGKQLGNLRGILSGVPVPIRDAVE